MLIASDARNVDIEFHSDATMINTAAMQIAIMTVATIPWDPYCTFSFVDLTFEDVISPNSWKIFLRPSSSSSRGNPLCTNSYLDLIPAVVFLIARTCH